MNHCKKVILLWIVIVVGLTLSCRRAEDKVGRAPGIDWMKILDGHGKSIVEDFDGNLVVAGNSSSFSKDRITEAYLSKINSSGEIIWENTYHHSGRYVAIDEVIQTSDSGYIMVGEVYIKRSAFCSLYVVRTDGNGDLIWSRAYGEAKQGLETCVAEDRSGNFVIGASTRLFGGPNKRHVTMDIRIICIDDKGDTLWTKAYLKKGKEEFFSPTLCANGKYLLVGVDYGEMYLLRTDSISDSLWIRNVDNINERYYGNSVKAVSGGGYIIAGYKMMEKWPKYPAWPLWPLCIPIFSDPIIEYFGFGIFADFYLAKIDERGSIMWIKEFGGKYFDEAGSVQETDDSGFIISGYTTTKYASSPGLIEIDGFYGYIAKIDRNGDVVWKKEIDIDGTELYSIIQTNDGGYATTGNFWIGSYFRRGLLIKLKPEE